MIQRASQAVRNILSPPIKPYELAMSCDELVGSPDAVQQLERTIASHVQARSKRGSKPYESMRSGFADALSNSSRNFPIYGDQKKLLRTGMVGIGFYISGLELIEGVYVAEARAPQKRASVDRNVKRVLGHITGFAFIDNDTAAINRAAMIKGVDPNSRQAKITHALKSRGMPGFVRVGLASNSLEVSSDESGQLSMDLRYPRLNAPDDNEARCPMSDHKVSHNDLNYPVLKLISNTLGNVAIDEIYPRSFEIIE